MTQSSHGTNPLPACWWALAAALAAAVPAAAQQRLRAERDVGFLNEPPPQGRVLATVSAGAEVALVSTRSGWSEVTLEGWIWPASVERVNRAGHDLVVAASGGENLRDAPNGAVVARLREGFLLDEVSRTGGWVRAKRTGWVPSAALAPVATAAPSPPAGRRPATPGPAAPPPQDDSPPDSAVTLDRALVARAAQLRRTPDGPASATLAPETPVKVLGRSGEWVRVQTEGWVRESDLRPAAGVLTGVSGAEVRSRPQEFEGKLLQWTAQFISVQTADELRREIPAGRRYVLARGPLPEAGFLYLIGTDEHLRAFERLAPLAQVIVVGRLLTARSQYLGNPILEIVDFRLSES